MLLKYDDKLKYQLKAKELADTYYKDNIKGIISMPCGTGKTYTSYLISQSYKQIIIISPLKQFAQQNLNRFIEYGFINKTLLIDSDGTRDINEINESKILNLIEDKINNFDENFSSFSYWKNFILEKKNRIVHKIQEV
mgnify:CR=1 FL=1